MAGVREEGPRIVTATAVEAPAAAQPRKGRGGVRRVPKVVWLFLLVPAVVEIGMVFWPAVNSFYLSLTKWNGLAVRCQNSAGSERMSSGQLAASASDSVPSRSWTLARATPLR